MHAIVKQFKVQICQSSKSNNKKKRKKGKKQKKFLLPKQRYNAAWQSKRENGNNAWKGARGTGDGKTDDTCVPLEEGASEPATTPWCKPPPCGVPSICEIVVARFCAVACFPQGGSYCPTLSSWRYRAHPQCVHKWWCNVRDRC